jgi:hypothetical protein
MSVKQMSTTQIQDDLQSIARMWPDGVPSEQSDRINALKGELKRRGEQARPISTPAQNRATSAVLTGPVDALTDDQLASELKRLSAADLGDEAIQTRFADVRFELRKRAKTEPSSSVSPRAIEIPEASEVAKPSPSKMVLPAGVKGFSAAVGGVGVIVRYTAQDTHGNVAQVAALMTVGEAEQFMQLVHGAIASAKETAS